MTAAVETATTRTIAAAADASLSRRMPFRDGRIGLEGYLAFAPDALTPVGGYPGDEDKAREKFGRLDQEKAHEDFVAAAAFLKAHPDCTGTCR